MTAFNYTLPPPIYLPSSGGYTGSRFTEDPLHRRVFPFRKYSMDEDGRLVCRTRSTNYEPRPKPYDRPQRHSTTSPSPESKQIDSSVFSQLFQQLMAIAVNEPLAFESKAPTICASFNLDPAMSANIIGSIKEQFPAIRNSETAIPSPPGGPANPTASMTPATPLMPLKRQRAFTSGPRGFTIWYSTESPESLSAPPAGLQVSAGMLYVHTNTTLGAHHAWLCDTNGSWTNVTRVDSVKHPVISDRFLLVRSDGVPSWLTKVDYTAVQARRERAGR